MTTNPQRRSHPLFAGALWCVLVLLGWQGTARAWWNGEWSLRKKVTVDLTATGGEIPDALGASGVVLLRLHDGNFQFTSAQDNGADLRCVADDDKTLLTYHIERFDSLLNEAFVWVKVPGLKAGAKTDFWLYYGNTGGKATRIDDPKGTYDAETVLVYHFTEHGQPPVDVSPAGNNGGNPGVESDGSFIGTGLKFDGRTGVTVPASPSLATAAGGPFTASVWAKVNVPGPNAAILSRRDGVNAFVLGSDQGVPYVEITENGNAQRTAPGAPLGSNGWHHLAAVAEGDRVTLYVDGAAYGSIAAPLPPLNAPLTLGGDPVPGAVGFNGEMDELELAKAARPIGALKLAAFGQGGDRAAKILIFGADEQTGSFVSGYFAIILKSVTPDGWVVIGILMVMAVFSWFVMANRVIYLNRISEGNRRFLREWEHVSGNLGLIADGDVEKAGSMGGRVDAKGQRALGQGAIYRVYRIGAEEVRRRLGGRAGAKVLSAAAIESIRASLDGGLVRESQKLNKLIVFLTLSISGGPFLGLLGTVVGVMITFAAIAAAGDVNVNSIAPGIAAALVATVAGLAVAIPALFGYNYLLSRIKDITADLRVFIDEFVTRLAEHYSTPNELTTFPSTEEPTDASAIRRQALR